MSAYAAELCALWAKSFGEEHVMTRKSVMAKLEKIATDYYNTVYNKGILTCESNAQLLVFAVSNLFIAHETLLFPKTNILLTMEPQRTL